MSGVAGNKAITGPAVDSRPMARRASRLRLFRTAVVLLLAGAIINVLVAWGCVIWLRPAYPRGLRVVTRGLKPAPDPLAEQPGWGILDVARSKTPRQGLREMTVVYARPVNSPEPVMRRGRFWHAGWPWPALATGLFNDTEVVGGFLPPAPVLYLLASDWPGGPQRPLPLVPRWPGFAINTALYAAVLASGLVGFRWWRHRRRAGCCQACGYDLRGNVSGVCPECGGKA